MTRDQQIRDLEAELRLTLTDARRRDVEGMLRHAHALAAREAPPRYSALAVDAAIRSSNRAGRRIGKAEAKRIHALLKGRD